MTLDIILDLQFFLVDSDGVTLGRLQKEKKVKLGLLAEVRAGGRLRGG